MSLWDELDDREYLDFAKFEKNGNHTEIYVQLVDEEPTLFKNRWGKEQLSIKVWLYRKVGNKFKQLESENHEDDQFLLVGGVRLFRVLKGAKDHEGILWIRRMGEGFKTQYKLIQKIKN